MKKYFLVIVAILLSANIFAQDFTKPIEYLDFIRSRQEKIQEHLWDYVSAMAHTNRSGKINRKKNDLINEVKQAREEVRKMPPLDGKTNLRDSVVLYFSNYLAMINDDYTELDELKEKAQDSWGAMMAYQKKQDEINERLNLQAEHISDLYEQFAKVHSIHLVDSESNLVEKMTKTNVVLDYYTKIYLLEFRLTLYERKLLNSIADNDTVSLSNYEDSLKIAIKETEPALKKIGGYGGDYSLKFACQKTIQNSKLILNTYLPKIKKYYTARREYDRQKALVDAKGQNNLTQEEVNAYNNSVNEVNAAIKDYNSAYEKMTTSFNKDSKQWNDTVDKFLDRYVPK